MSDKIKLSELRQIIREELNKALTQEAILDEKTPAVQKAKQMGLDYMSFGRWGKNGKVTHITQDGNLKPVSKQGQLASRDRAQKSTGLKWGKTTNIHRSKPQIYGTKDQPLDMVSPTSKYGSRVAKYDPKTGNVKSLTKRTPDQERSVQKYLYQKINSPELAKKTGKLFTTDPLADRRDFYDRSMAHINEPKTKYDHIASPYLKKVQTAIDNSKLKPDKDYSPNEFMTITGLRPQQFKFLSLFNDKYLKNTNKHPLFYYDTNKDSVSIYDDPMDYS